MFFHDRDTGCLKSDFINKQVHGMIVMRVEGKKYFGDKLLFDPKYDSFGHLGPRFPKGRPVLYLYLWPAIDYRLPGN